MVDPNKIVLGESVTEQKWGAAACTTNRQLTEAEVW